MQKKSDTLFNFLEVMAWLGLVGFAIQTLKIAFNFVYGFFNRDAIKEIFTKTDLTDLFTNERSSYVLIVTIFLSTYILKTSIFYVVTRIFKKLNFVKPFDKEISKNIKLMSYLSFTTGILGFYGISIIQLAYKGVEIHNRDISELTRGGYMMMGGILYIIAKIFDKGIEIQGENELTV